MKEIIDVGKALGGVSQIVIGDVISDIKSYVPEGKVVVITDSNIHRRYKSLIEQFDFILIGLGETNKTLTTIEKIYDSFIELGVDRHSFILGIGGGIVTDVAGFAASTFMRGVPFGFAATTLLAQVDASVGGKNGVNIHGFKNMVGTFNQPQFVLCDTAMLQTLPDRELRAGLAEIVKGAVIADPELFDLLERSTFEEIKSETQLLTRIIGAAVRVKAGIVGRDEHEHGERKKLNLGHTFAHAIEKCSGDFLHGEAVAIGMAIICAVAVKEGLMNGADADRVVKVLKNIGLPTESTIDMKRLLKAVKSDKKKNAATIDMIVPCAIGDCQIRTVSFERMEELFG